jgi:hypothetical protein
VFLCLLCSVQPCHIYPYYLIRISERFIEYKMRILVFSITCFWRISRSKKNSVRYCDKCLLVFIYSTRYSYHTLINLFKKISGNTQIRSFMKIRLVTAGRVVPCVRSGGQSDLTKLTGLLLFAILRTRLTNHSLPLSCAIKNKDNCIYIHTCVCMCVLVY